MATTKQQDVKEIKELFKKIGTAAGDAAKKAGTLGDKGLVEKIQKTKQSADETVKHIEQRTSESSQLLAMSEPPIVIMLREMIDHYRADIRMCEFHIAALQSEIRAHLVKAAQIKS